MGDKPQDVSGILASLRTKAKEYPTGPFQQAAEVIQQLHESCKRLSERLNVDGVSSVTMQPRVRRPTPKFPKGTPAHIRILANIVKDEETGCWIWAGSGSDFHGTIRADDGRSDGTHRVMYEYHNKCKLKPGQHVRHTCDRGFCVNPDHLIVGTVKDNAQDRSERRRGGIQKLTSDDALDILIRYRKGESASVLSDEYGVSPMQVRRIGVDAFTYLNDHPSVENLPKKVGQQRHSKLDDESVREIKRLIREKVPQKEIARMFGVDSSLISNINNGQRWRHVD